MKDEADPITDDEWLIRRIPQERFSTEKVPPISTGAFEPRLKGRDIDLTGISMYRAACLADPLETLATVQEDRRHKCGLVQLQVAFLKSLGLSVQPEHDGRVKGHVVLPELKATDYREQREHLLPKQRKMAEEASREENILKRPGPPESTSAETT